MPAASRFRRLPCREDQQIQIWIDELPVQARVGDTVAAAVLMAGLNATRSTPVSGSPRAPYCLMGVCFDCLMEIDGIANRQACMVTVREGMRIRCQQGARSLTEQTP